MHILASGQFLFQNKKVYHCGTFTPNKTTVTHKYELETFPRQRSHCMITTKYLYLFKNMYLAR